MPSPIAVFTSAPCFRRVRTASLFPCIAASATDGVPVAARSAAGRGSTDTRDVVPFPWDIRYSAPIAHAEISVLRIIVRLLC
jgi:hypothetical protein